MVVHLAKNLITEKQITKGYWRQSAVSLERKGKKIFQQARILNGNLQRLILLNRLWEVVDELGVGGKTVKVIKLLDELPVFGIVEVFSFLFTSVKEDLKDGLVGVVVDVGYSSIYGEGSFFYALRELCDLKTVHLKEIRLTRQKAKSKVFPPIVAIYHNHLEIEFISIGADHVFHIKTDRTVSSQRKTNQTDSNWYLRLREGHLKWVRIINFGVM